MKFKSIFQIFILLIAVTFSSCKEFKEVEVVGVKDFKLKKIGLEGIEALIELNIKNPNNMGFSIYPSEFDIIFSGMNLGKAKLKKRVHIDANCEKAYTFELNSSFKEFNFMDITKMLSGSKLGTMQVKGDLKAGKMWVKKKFPIDYKTSDYKMSR
ncbi:MAG: LEA type 2 family protein [Bacteroidetes bacterium]|nr:LEA type 2 family protein [Bacteroidota bacterium]